MRPFGGPQKQAVKLRGTGLDQEITLSAPAPAMPAAKNFIQPRMVIKPDRTSNAAQLPSRKVIDIFGGPASRTASSYPPRYSPRTYVLYVPLRRINPLCCQSSLALSAFGRIQ
jgi:hypothetical protein